MLRRPLSGVLYLVSAITLMGGISVGSYSVNEWLKSSYDELFFDALVNFHQRENFTIRDFWKKSGFQLVADSGGLEFIEDDDVESWRLVSYLNSGRIHEIVDKLEFEYDSNEDSLAFDYSKEDFKKMGYKFISFDYSDVLRKHCSKYLDIKYSDVFPDSTSSFIKSYFEDFWYRIVPWCTKPKGSYEKTKKLLKEVKDGSVIGFFLYDSKFYKDHSIRSTFEKYGIDLNSWWAISNVLDFCRGVLKSSNNIYKGKVPDDSDLKKMCLRDKNVYGIFPIKGLKSYELKPAVTGLSSKELKVYLWSKFNKVGVRNYTSFNSRLRVCRYYSCFFS